MASNLLELRKAAGYKNSNDFALAHKMSASTYARYESSPDKIPMGAARKLADIFGTTIDAIVDRETPDPACMRGEVQLEYDGLTPEARALADELREFVLMKDEKIRERRRREEERPYEALCYQYERQMLAEMGEGAAFGELVAFESVEAARAAIEYFLREQAARPRGEHPAASTRSRRRRSSTTGPSRRSWRPTTAPTASSSSTARACCGAPSTTASWSSTTPGRARGEVTRGRRGSKQVGPRELALPRARRPVQRQIQKGR